MSGTLFVVATPIGNLEDITFRALRTLKEVDLIAAEDTRHTLKLLTHYGIRKPLTSLHEHNEYREAPRLVERLRSGASIALVSDAGTPGIADPGTRLVRAARAEGIKVTSIPGPSAVAAALSVSGFAASQFVFMGFPPRSGQARADWVGQIQQEARTVVFFEAPHRIKRTLEEIASMVKRPILIHRELTKINEILVEYTETIGNQLPELGEFVVVIEGNTADLARETVTDETRAKADLMYGLLTNNGAFSDSAAVDLVSRALQLQPREVVKAVKKLTIARRRRDALP